MARIGNDMDTHQIAGGNFNFTGARLDTLLDDDYTLVTIAVDVTGSTQGFEGALRKTLITAVKACKKSPTVDRLLLRVITFSSSFDGNVNELHGFTLVNELNPDDYSEFRAGGATPLYDATYSSVGALVDYGKKMYGDQEINNINGIVFIITDGAEGGYSGGSWIAVSTATPSMIREKVAEVVKGEQLESLVTVLIGINADEYQSQLEAFKDDAGFDQYIDAGEATEGKLAKLADFVSQSVSSQSQALGTGGPSQNIAAEI